MTSNGVADLNATLSDSQHTATSDGESNPMGASNGVMTASPSAFPGVEQRHRLDENQLSGFGRLAAEPRTQTSRKGDDYIVLRVAQNVRLAGARIVTNYFDLICFGGAHEIGKGLAMRQEVYFRGTFGQEPFERPGHPLRFFNKVIVEYLRPLDR